jgi:hypothetical protein
MSTTPTSAAARATGLTKVYGQGDTKIIALDRISPEASLQR